MNILMSQVEEFIELKKNQIKKKEQEEAEKKQKVILSYARQALRHFIFLSFERNQKK
jgi:hypothetical protein